MESTLRCITHHLCVAAAKEFVPHMAEDLPGRPVVRAIALPRHAPDEPILSERPDVRRMPVLPAHVIDRMGCAPRALRPRGSRLRGHAHRLHGLRGVSWPSEGEGRAACRRCFMAKARSWASLRSSRSLLLFWLALRARSLPPYLNKTSTSTTNAAIAATRRAASPHDLGLPQFMAQPMPKRRGTTTDESSRFT